MASYHAYKLLHSSDCALSAQFRQYKIVLYIHISYTYIIYIYHIHSQYDIVGTLALAAEKHP